jgi:hypothetical protein
MGTMGREERAEEISEAVAEGDGGCVGRGTAGGDTTAGGSEVDVFAGAGRSGEETRAKKENGREAKESAKEEEQSFQRA